MSKYISMSAKKYQNLLWVIAIVFYFVLSGLGSLIMSELPGVEPPPTYQELLNADQSYLDALEEKNKIRRSQQDQREKIKESEEKVEKLKTQIQNLQSTLNAFTSTRQATNDSDYNSELFKRTTALEKARNELDQEQVKLAEEKAKMRLIGNNLDAASKEVSSLSKNIRQQSEKAEQKFNESAFVNRLMICLPLLIVAGFAFARYKGTEYWPFVYGFGAFALTTFFVKLLPYAPNTGIGKYLFYIAGLGITIVIGKKVSQALSQYLKDQQELESKSTEERKKALTANHGYDVATSKLKKGNCPSCEKPIATVLSATRYEDRPLHCPHCGFGIRKKCASCGEVKSALTKFCVCCGAPDSVVNETAE